MLLDHICLGHKLLSDSIDMDIVMDLMVSLHLTGKDMRIIVFCFRPRTKQVSFSG